ncbi:MAG: STAS domain-containing protein [Spirochaetota bacterium]
MEVYSKINNDSAILKVEGKFNIDYIERFDQIIKEVFEKHPSVIAVDLHDVEYIDSSALGSLIKAMNIAKKQSISLYLYNLQENIHDVFKLSYLDKFFLIQTTAEMKDKYPDIQFEF